MTDTFAANKDAAAAWFRTLRDTICAEFEAIERDAPADLYPGEPGTFVYEDWQRKVENGGGGTGGMLRGRLFEKCGVHISVVKGDEYALYCDDPRLVWWRGGPDAHSSH